MIEAGEVEVWEAGDGIQIRAAVGIAVLESATPLARRAVEAADAVEVGGERGGRRGVAANAGGTRGNAGGAASLGHVEGGSAGKPPSRAAHVPKRARVEAGVAERPADLVEEPVLGCRGTDGLAETYRRRQPTRRGWAARGGRFSFSETAGGCSCRRSCRWGDCGRSGGARARAACDAVLDDLEMAIVARHREDRSVHKAWSGVAVSSDNAGVGRAGHGSRASRWREVEPVLPHRAELAFARAGHLRGRILQFTARNFGSQAISLRSSASS